MDLWSKRLLIKSSPYKAGELIFESSTAGSYTVDLKATGNYEVYVIGGGAGSGTKISDYKWYTGGGSGAGFIGVVKLTKGSYSIQVGAGGKIAKLADTTFAGGSSKISDAIEAYGGKSVTVGEAGTGGSKPTVNVPIISTTLNTAGKNGKQGQYYLDSTYYVTVYCGASVYKGYGKGGQIDSEVLNAGKAGYVKIVYMGG